MRPRSHSSRTRVGYSETPRALAAVTSPRTISSAFHPPPMVKAAWASARKPRSERKPPAVAKASAGSMVVMKACSMTTGRGDLLEPVLPLEVFVLLGRRHALGQQCDDDDVEPGNAELVVRCVHHQDRNR